MTARLAARRVIATIGHMTYVETIRPPWWAYAVVIALAALLCFNFAAAITLPVATVVFVLAAAGLIWLVGRLSLRVSVDAHEMTVGSEKLERSRISAVTALDTEGMRQAAGSHADVRAHMILRNLSTGEGVRIDLRDGDVPYWLVSSKRPAVFAEALES